MSHPLSNPFNEARGKRQSPLPNLNGRRLTILFALGLLTVALLLAIGGGREAISALSSADWRLVAAAAAIHYSGFAVRGHRWQLLLKAAGHRLPYRYVTGLLLSGWFISALVPARAGDAARVGLLRAPLNDVYAPVPVATGASTIVLERALDMLAILLLAAAFGLGVLRDRLPGWVLVTYAVALTLLVGLSVAVLAAPRLIDALRKITGWALWQKALDFGAQIVDSLRRLPRRPAVAALVVAESLYIWLCDALLLWLVVASLGTWLGVANAAFVALTVDVIAAVPITPGGIGQIEAAYGALLALLPAQTTFNIAAAVLIARAVSYWSFLLISGVVTYVAGFGQVIRGHG